MTKGWHGLLLQVLYYCPGLRDGMKKLHKLSKRRAKSTKEEEKTEEVSSLFCVKCIISVQVTVS